MGGRGIKWGLGSLAGLAILLVAAWASVPGLVRGQAQGWVRQNLPGMELSLGEIRFNPIALKLELDDLAIGDTAAPPMLAVRRLTLDASIMSLLTASAWFDAVVVQAPRLETALLPDGSLNLARLLPPDDGSPPPRLRIADLKLEDGALSFTDLRRSRPETVRLTPISFDLLDFNSAPGADGEFRLSGHSESGEAFDFKGRLGLQPLASRGTLKLTDLQLDTLKRLAGDALPLDRLSGVLSLAGSYDVVVPPDIEAFPAMKARLNHLRLEKMEATAGQTGARLDVLELDDVDFALDARQVLLAALRLEGLEARLGTDTLKLASARLAGSRVDLQGQRLVLGPLALTGIGVSGGKAPPVTLAGLELDKAALDFSARTAGLGQVSLQGLSARPALDPDLQVRLPGLWPRPPAPGPGWQLALDGVRAEGTQLEVTSPGPDLRLELPLVEVGAIGTGADATPMTMELTVNRSGSLAARGELAVASLTGQFALQWTGLDLAALAGLAPALPVKIDAGNLAGSGNLRLARGVPSFAGRVNLQGLSLSESRADSEPAGLLRLAALDVQGLAASATALSMRQLALDGLSAQVRLGRDGKLNLVSITGEDAAEQGGTTSGGIGDLLVHVDEVRVRRSAIGFEDLSIQPNFAVRVEALEGRITNVDSRPGRLAEVALKGQVVDRFSPVLIEGRGNLFDYAAATDVIARFENIELPVFNPYSGRFAGYAIARGKLTTTLHYVIDNRALKADHKVIIDQLSWGEATDSKDKVSLPIRLATSLLKDRNGVIRLDLPVGGTVDDPNFRIWPVIWQVVGNIMTKLVTAPFALIGSLFGGGGEKAQFIAFAPGSADMGAETAAALAALARGLADRPELNLDIPAGPASREDALALSARKMAEAGRAAAKSTEWAALDDGKRLDALRKVYKAKTGKGAVFPEDVKEKPARLAWLESQLQPLFMPGDMELAALGQARANAVKAALIGDDGLVASRLFLTTRDMVTLKDGVPTMELKIR